ncbi:MAG TPA: PilN domain-containing protein [Lacipirellulaceae bacterium]|nr:PilN domain-containing protein [Lacipirellulaceae bacterium]
MSTQTKDRRQSIERRQFGDRRRQGEGRCAVIEVCRSMLHLALVVRSSSGNNSEDKIVTRSVRWRNEATSLHTDRGVQELTAAFRSLVTNERLMGARVRIALSGELCVTRVITGPTDDVRREFADLEERSLRYLRLGPGRKALASSIQQLDARHQYALLAVANQRTLDLLMEIATSVNVQIESIEPSLIALSRAQARLRESCQEACVMIQLDEDVAELGVCHRGRLLLDYRPGGQTNAENVADVVAQHLSRLQRYLERYHSYLTAPLADVYLAGDPQAVAVAQAKFAQMHGVKVHVLEPNDLAMDWKHAAATPGTDLAAALGTAMSLYESDSNSLGPNLIASTLAQLRPPMKPILIRSLMPLAAVLLVAAGLMAIHLNERRIMHGLRADLERLQPACIRATELRLNLLAAEAKLKQLEALSKQLPHPEWQQILTRISQSMPNDVWLDRLSFHDERSAAISGASYTDNGVYDFVNYLKQVPDIAEIALEGTGVGQSTTGTTTSFNLQLTLASAAGRNEKDGKHD